MTVNAALKDNDVSYESFYTALAQADIGYWNSINSTEIIQYYIIDMMRNEIRVSHILSKLEEHMDCDDWKMDLCNSMNTPEPIFSKKELIDALSLDKADLKKKLVIEKIK